MGPDIRFTDEFEQGRIYEYRNSIVYVPHDATDQIGAHVDTDKEAVRAAVGLNRDTPPGVVVFEKSDSSVRDAETRAQLWAAIVDTVMFLDVLEWRPTTHERCWEVEIPVVIAAEGKAAMAAYLATHGFGNDDIAGVLGVGNRTVSQYISDFRKGER